MIAQKAFDQSTRVAFDQSTRVGIGTRQSYWLDFRKKKGDPSRYCAQIDLQRVNCHRVYIKTAFLTSYRNLNFPKQHRTKVNIGRLFHSCFLPVSLSIMKRNMIKEPVYKVLYCVVLPGLRPDGFSHDREVLKKARSINYSAVQYAVTTMKLLFQF